MSVGTGIGLAAAIGAVGSIGSSAIGAIGANKAAGAQAGAAQQGINVNQPFLNAGTSSLSQLMKGLDNGTFGTPSTFTAPTQQQVENTDAYKFQQEQGDQGILQASAASGGAISGGTAKALAGYNQQLAGTAYNNVFNQTLQGFNANLTSQQQAFQQLLAPTQIGEQAAGNISQLLGAKGNATAAGDIGVSNAITGGIGSGTNSITQSLLLNQLLGGSQQQLPYSSTGNVAQATLAGTSYLNGPSSAGLLSPTSLGTNPGPTYNPPPAWAPVSELGPG